MLCQFREGCVDQAEAEASPSAPEASIPSVVGELSLSRSGSSSSGKSDSVKLTNPVQDLLIRVFSSNSNGRGVRLAASPSQNDPAVSLTAQSLTVGSGSYREWDGTAQESPPGSVISSCYSSSALDAAPLSLPRTITQERRLELNQSKESSVSDQSSPPSVLVSDVTFYFSFISCTYRCLTLFIAFGEKLLKCEGFLQDGNLDDNLCDQLEQALVEAENAKRAALQEAMNRGKAEKDFLEAVRRVNLYFPVPCTFCYSSMNS